MLKQGILILTCLVLVAKGHPAVRSPPDSCWPELEQLLSRLGDLFQKDGNLIESIPVADRGPFQMVTTPTGRQQIACILEGIKSAEDLQGIIPGDPQQTGFMILAVKQSIQQLGGREGIRNLGQGVNALVQFWIDVDVSTLPVQGFTREQLVQKWTDSTRVILNALQILPMLGSPESLGDDAGKMADALLESTNVQELGDRIGYPQHRLETLSNTAFMQNFQEMATVVFAIVDELLAKNFLGLGDTGEQGLVTEPYGPTQSGGTCWPSLRTKMDNMVKLSEETPILEMVLAYAINMVYGIDLINKETRDAQMDQLACKLDGVKSVSDLAEVLPNVSEMDVRRGYAMFQQMFTAMGGMDTARSIVAAYNDLIQLFIEMDFPHVPIRSMTRQEVDERLTEILKKLLPIFGAMAAPGPGNIDVDEKKTRVLDALFDSPDIFVFAGNMKAADQAPLIYQVGSDLPKWQQALAIEMSTIEELYSHGFMQLAIDGVPEQYETRDSN